MNDEPLGSANRRNENGGNERTDTHPLITLRIVAAPLVAGVLLLGLGLWGAAPARAQTSTAFTYQGYLEEGGAPAAGPVDLRFTLYESESGGSQIGPTLTREDVRVNDGVFAVDLDFGAVFSEGTRFLEVAVRESGSGDSFSALSPREALRPAPAAITAFSLPNVSVDEEGKVGIGTESPSSPLTVDGMIESTSGGVMFPDGTTQTTAGVSSGNAWSLGGNAGTDPTTDFLGTTDEVALELRTAGQRALRIVPATDATGNFVPNLIGGHPANIVGEDVGGATISGGGLDDGSSSQLQLNRVTAHYGTVGGGRGNRVSGSSATIGGGSRNSANSFAATVGGGRRNIASASRATVGGGFENNAAGNLSTIGGGDDNLASAGIATIAGGGSNTAYGSYSTVGGGQSNSAQGDWSTIPGGFENLVLGDYSFAAGQQAEAVHDGSFVWADSEPETFGTTDHDQFLIRARGGMGIGTDSPNFQLSLGSSLSHTKIALYDASPTNHFGMGVVPGQFSFHLNGDGARYAFYDTPSRNNEIVTFQGSGNVVIAGSLIENSDRRLKSDIAPLGAALAKLLALRPVHFQFKEGTGHPDTPQIGLVAQEVERVFPELVTRDSEGYLSLAYSKLTAVLLKGLQEQQTQIEAQQTEIEALRQRVERLKALQTRLDRLEAQLAPAGQPSDPASPPAQ